MKTTAGGNARHFLERTPTMKLSPKMTKTVTIGFDCDVERPDSTYDGWKPISFCRRHNNFEHPAAYCLNKPENMGLRRKLQVGLAFRLSYYEHGLCKWSLRGEGPQCRWDSVDIAGLLIWTGKPTDIGALSYDDRATDARNFLEEYTDWCNGNCYWFSLESAEQPLNSCGGFIGTNQLTEAINEALEESDKVIVRGEAAYLTPYLNLKATIVEEAV
jgi:hypothetical protein